MARQGRNGYYRSDVPRRRRTPKLPRRLQRHEKLILEGRFNYPVFEDQCIESPADGLLVEPENADYLPDDTA